MFSPLYPPPHPPFRSHIHRPFSFVIAVFFCTCLPLLYLPFSFALVIAVLREGSWWSELQEYLRSNGVQPIEADVTMLQVHLDHYFEATQTVSPIGQQTQTNYLIP